MYQLQTHYADVARPIPSYSEPGFFFNEEAQLRQQDGGSFQLLTVLNMATRQLDARCAVFADTDRASSPKMAPFGSVEFSNTLPQRTLAKLLDSLEGEVARLGLPLLRLVNYPHCYAPPQAERLVGELRRRRYTLTHQLVNFHLNVTEEPLTHRMHLSERRRLSKCLRAGFKVTALTSPPVDAVVRFIQDSRRQQGYPLTIDPDRLTFLLTNFPEYYPVVMVQDGDTIAALTVAVRVRGDILYNFLPADNMAYRTFSPSVLLTQGLYAYCQQERITLLDLGVSVDDDRCAKPGLMQFKRNLGAFESAKMIWEKRV